MIFFYFLQPPTDPDVKKPKLEEAEEEEEEGETKQKCEASSSTAAATTTTAFRPWNPSDSVGQEEQNGEREGEDKEEEERSSVAPMSSSAPAEFVGEIRRTLHTCRPTLPSDSQDRVMISNNDCCQVLLI